MVNAMCTCYSAVRTQYFILTKSRGFGCMCVRKCWTMATQYLKKMVTDGDEVDSSEDRAAEKIQ